MVEKAAICTGSGKSMISDVLAKGAQVYVTGDIDHHTGIDAVAQWPADRRCRSLRYRIYFYESDGENSERTVSEYFRSHVQRCRVRI